MVRVPADVAVCTPAFLHITEYMPSELAAGLPHLGPEAYKTMNPSIRQNDSWKTFLDGLGVLLAKDHENANVFCVTIDELSKEVRPGTHLKPETIKEPGLIFSSNRTAELSVKQYMTNCMKVLIDLKRLRKDKKKGTDLYNSRVSALVELAYQTCWDKARHRADKNGRLTALSQFLMEVLAKKKLPQSLRNDLAPFQGEITQLLGLISHAVIPDAERCKHLHEICNRIRASVEDVESDLHAYLRDSAVVISHRRPVHILRKAFLLTYRIESLLGLVAKKDMKKLLERMIKHDWISHTVQAGDFRADLSNEDNIKGQYEKAIALKREEVASWEDMYADIDARLNEKDEHAYGDLYTISGERHRVFSHSQAFEHCEGILLGHLLRKGIPFYRYIGCSKLCCYLCFTYIRAVNKAFPTQKIAVRACHRKAYPRWRATHITEQYWKEIEKYFPGLMWIDMGIICKECIRRAYPDSDSAPESTPDEDTQ